MAVLLAVAALPARAAGPLDWPGWGGILDGNERFAPFETKLGRRSVGRLQPRWVFTTRGNVTATPTVEGHALYATDDGGGVHRVDTRTGQAVWSRTVGEYTGIAWSWSRSSPAIAGDLVVIADRKSGNVMALRKDTGELAWRTVVETHPYTSLTASPVVHGGVVYIGVSSNEEYGVTTSAGYVPSFRGSIVAIELATGRIVWKTPMAPEGYSGAAVWGSGFAISPLRNTIYVATGNNYSVPASVSTCVAGASGTEAQLACLAPADYVDAVVALDMSTGAVRWARRVQGADTYNLNCVAAAPLQPCPTPTGPDANFASAPNLFVALHGRHTRELLGAGQKSGVYWALDPDDGALVWSSQPGPGSVRGGIMWGSAVDLDHVYVAENDAAHLPYQLGGSGPTITGGSWAALNTIDGRVDWQVPAGGAGAETGAESALSVANGVVYGGTVAGDMVALSSATGRELWRFASGGSVTCGPAIVRGSLYWGSGDPYGLRNNRIYAFSLPDGE